MKLEAMIEAEAVEGWKAACEDTNAALLACSPQLTQVAFLYKPGPPA